MMAKAAVLDMTGKKIAEDKSKKTKQPLHWLEERPRPEWFVRIKSVDGRVEWFLRFSMTGLATRRYGPFGSKRQCLRFLNEVVEKLWFDGLAEIEDAQSKYRMEPREFEPSDCVYPFMEHTIALHAKQMQRKGR